MPCEHSYDYYTHTLTHASIAGNMRHSLLGRIPVLSTSFLLDLLRQFCKIPALLTDQLIAFATAL